MASSGASLTRGTPRRGKLIGERARLLQVDIDEEAIGAHRPAEVGLHGDAALTAAAILEALGQGSPATWRTTELAEQIARRRWRHQPYVDASGGGRLDPPT